MQWKCAAWAQPVGAEQGHGRTRADTSHTETRSEDDSRSCSARVVGVAGRNRHAGSSRVFAPHHNAGQEEAGPEAAGRWWREEEGNRWARRWETANSCLWIAGRGEADSGWCCRRHEGLGWAAASCWGAPEAVASADSAGGRLPRPEGEGRRILEAGLVVVGGPLYGRCDPTWSKRGDLRVAPACRLSRLGWLRYLRSVGMGGSEFARTWTLQRTTGCPLEVQQCGAVADKGWWVFGGESWEFFVGREGGVAG